MILWVASAAGLLIAYLFGSLPTGYLAGRVVAGIDIREHGSNSTGATNVLRILGKGPALVVLAVDALKGAAAIVFARWFYSWLYTMFSRSAGMDRETFVSWGLCLCGLAVLLGHGRSVWLNFTGGKSAATGIGVLLAVSPPIGIVAAVVWGIMLASFRIVSLSSIAAAVVAITLAIGFALPLPVRLLVIAGGCYVIVRHRANMQRLVMGSEPRLGRTLP